MKIQYLYTSIYIFIKRKWVTDIISIEKNRWFRKVSSNSEKLLYVFVWLKGQWTLHAWQKFRKHWVAHAPSLLKVLKKKKKRPSRGTALPRPGNPAKTLPRTEEWKLKHTLSLKTGGRWLLVFSVTARITSSWCHVAASCVRSAEELDGRSQHQEQSHSPFLSCAWRGNPGFKSFISLRRESLAGLAPTSPLFSDISNLKVTVSGWQTPNLLRLLVTLWSPAWPCGRSSRLLLLWYGPLHLIWKEPVSVARKCKP